MDELTPSPHHQSSPRRPSRRRRRVRLTSLIVTALVTVILALSHTTPAPPAVPSPAATPDPTDAKSPLEQAANTVNQAKDTILGAQPGLWRVTHVVDGDTLNVSMGTQKETVRLLGIDTPETHDPRKPVQCFGEAAASHTRSLLEGKNVRLEPDPTDSDRDKYHRLLRYVYLPDGALVNATLIRDGYAFAYTVFPLVKLDEFRALETEAREAGRGLWSGCNVDDSKQIKQTTGSK